MNIIYTPSPLLKEVKFKSESLPVVIRVNKFDESAAATLSGLKKQLGRAFAFYASHDPDYEPDALNKYKEETVQKYR